MVTERSNIISSANMIIETYLETASGNEKNERINNIESFFSRADGISLSQVRNNHQAKYISKD